MTCTLHSHLKADRRAGCSTRMATGSLHWSFSQPEAAYCNAILNNGGWALIRTSSTCTIAFKIMLYLNNIIATERCNWCTEISTAESLIPLYLVSVLPNTRLGRLQGCRRREKERGAEPGGMRLPRKLKSLACLPFSLLSAGCSVQTTPPRSSGRYYTGDRNWPKEWMNILKFHAISA